LLSQRHPVNKLFSPLCTMELLILSSLILSSTAFVVQDKSLEQIEVGVNYGSELERLLVAGVEAGRSDEVLNLLIAEISSIESRVRSRGFHYIGEGVRIRGTTVGATRAVIDSVKSVMVDTLNRLELAKQEISLLLQEPRHSFITREKNDRIRCPMLRLLALEASNKCSSMFMSFSQSP